MQRRLHRYMPLQFLLSFMLVDECVRAVACYGYRCMREDAFRVLRRAGGPVPFFHARTVCSFHALSIFGVLHCPLLGADGQSALHLFAQGRSAGAVLQPSTPKDGCVELAVTALKSLSHSNHA